MGFKDILDTILGLTEESKGLIKGVSSEVNKTVEKIEEKIESITIKALKASSVFILIFVGLIFALVGLSSYLSEVWNLTNGIGYVIVGGALILLGWFAKAVR